MIENIDTKLITLVFPFALTLSFIIFALTQWGYDFMAGKVNKLLFGNNENKMSKLKKAAIDEPENKHNYDDYAQMLLDEGKFTQAMDYVRGMIRIAREQNDFKTVQQYQALEIKVGQHYRPRRRIQPSTVDGIALRCDGVAHP